MTTFVADTLHLLRRHVMTTLRIPIWVLVTLVQPIIWLALYGQLFRRVVEIPGFSASSYIQFLTPGVTIMTAMFGSAWAGMGLLDDLTTGVMDRLLATPVRRGAIITARVLHSSLTVLVQAVIILALGAVLGADFPGGAPGFLAILALGAMLGAAFSALSNGLALITRREETLIAVLNFFGLPLTFLSSTFMASQLMPGWIRTIARANPVNWAVVGARDAMLGANWDGVALRAGLLAAFVLLCGTFATQAFRLYRRST
ncbi:MAG: ABC transporter permease [Thermomicrobiaceae bacterium]|nr:ABC transporter permease [Thermomicrobiaceae bacterium]